MTRKRFIKLMMAKGFQRNAANILAEKAISTYGSYQAYFDHRASMNSALMKAEKAFRNLSRSIIYAADTIARNCNQVATLARMLQGHK